MSLYFVKQDYPSSEYDSVSQWLEDEITGYMGTMPDIATNGYSVYVQDHIVDIFIFAGLGKGFYSATHLCMDKNSCIADSLKFIDSVKKKAVKDQVQLALF